MLGHLGPMLPMMAYTGAMVSVGRCWAYVGPSWAHVGPMLGQVGHVEPKFGKPQNMNLGQKPRTFRREVSQPPFRARLISFENGRGRNFVL